MKVTLMFNFLRAKRTRKQVLDSMLRLYKIKIDAWHASRMASGMPSNLEIIKTELLTPDQFDRVFNSHRWHWLDGLALRLAQASRKVKFSVRRSGVGLFERTQVL